MGRKKKFIDKKESSTFHVVHRSQQDKAVEGDSKASDFVLVPSAPRKDCKKSGLAAKPGVVAKGGGFSELYAAGDHINSLGLPNDGYDYERHLKTIGGGTFVSRRGWVHHSSGAGGGGGIRGPGGGVELPEEALPSEETLERQLEAVTISENVMDSDMRRALSMGLTGYTSEEEEAGELDDDFVVQAAGAGDDEGGFDFDAHVERLMAASARETGLLRQRTAEDNLPSSGLTVLRRCHGAGGEGRGGGEGGSDSDSDGDGSDKEGSSGEFDEALLEGLTLGQGNTGEGGGGVGAEAGGETETEASRAVLEAQFEATLAGYGSDEWGELDEEDDRVQGCWDPEQHEYTNKVMDEFLVEKEECAWVDGVTRLEPILRQNVVAGGPHGGEGDAGDGKDTKQQGVGGGIRLGKLAGLGAGRQETEGEEEDYDDEGKEYFDSVEESFEYLKKKQEEHWDCNTIVSTYSNLDNHPSIVKLVRRRGRRGKATTSDDTTTSLSSPHQAGAGGGRGGGECGDTKIELSSKTGLPVDILPVRLHNEGMVSLMAGRNEGEKRGAHESAEEKRLRKEQVKLQKKAKREQKKKVKVAFASEAKVVAHALANPEAPQNRSVFSYS